MQTQITPVRVAAALLLLGGSLACLPTDSADYAAAQEFRDALPVADNLEVYVPESSAKALGELAEYYEVTLDTTRWLNGATLYFVSLAHLMAVGVPASVSETGATWGPYRGDGLDPLEYLLEVERLDETRYSYAVSVRPKTNASAEWVPVMFGTNDPGNGERGPVGDITLDFSARNTVAPSFQETGTISAEYDLSGFPATNDIVFVDFVNNRGEGPFDATYGYEVDASGAGSFAIAVDGNIDDEPLEENLQIVSSWQADGAGRADVTATRGDLGEQRADIVECWDTSYLRVFYTATWDAPELDAPWLYTEGSGESCAF